MLFRRLPLAVIVTLLAGILGWYLLPILALTAVLAAGSERLIAARLLAAARDDANNAKAEAHLAVLLAAPPTPAKGRAPVLIGRPPLAPTVYESKAAALSLRQRLGMKFLHTPMWMVAAGAWFMGHRASGGRHALVDDDTRNVGDEYNGGRHAADPGDRPLIDAADTTRIYLDAPAAPAPAPKELRTLADDWRISTGEWDRAYKRFFANTDAPAGVR